MNQIIKTKIPPIKSQGIKTKFIPNISYIMPKCTVGRWIEPFTGTGVVAFNLSPGDMLLCDTNIHLINFYNAVLNGIITPSIVREFLEKEGLNLLEKGEDYYYYVRDRFNSNFSPLDFLFLNRSGFNGMIRFNKKGEFNIPFCKKPKRFSKSYITKIVNQLTNLCNVIKYRNVEFKCQPFEETIKEASENDLIYCDPPYIDRNNDYYNNWSECDEYNLFQLLKETPAKFILSTWANNKYRKNKYLEEFWGIFNISLYEHFYHVGGKEENRHAIIEALITNY